MFAKYIVFCKVSLTPSIDIYIISNIYNICDQVVSSRDASTEELDRVSVVERSQLGTGNRVNTIQVTTHILSISITFPYILFVTLIVLV